MSSNSKRKKVKRNNGNPKAKWVYISFILAFGLSLFFGLISEILLSKVNIFVSFFILSIIIAIGVIFDIIGIAVTYANESPFHSMASDKIPGGKEAVVLLKNAAIISNICNDIVGDISGIISGAVGVAILIRINMFSSNDRTLFFSILITAVISTLTIGGKAVGKGVAINNSKQVVYTVALILNKVKKYLNLEPFTRK